MVRALLFSLVDMLFFPPSHAFRGRTDAFVRAVACSLFDVLKSLEKYPDHTACATMDALGELPYARVALSVAPHWSPTDCSCVCRDETKLGEVLYVMLHHVLGVVPKPGVRCGGTDGCSTGETCHRVYLGTERHGDTMKISLWGRKFAF